MSIVSDPVPGGLAVAQPGADPQADLVRVAQGVLARGAARSLVVASEEIVLRDDPLAHGTGCDCAPGNLMDPPFAPTPREFRPWLEGFSWALVLQADAPTDGFLQGQPAWACHLKSMREAGDYAGFRDTWERLHDSVMWTERELFRRGYYLSVGFTALTCTLCHTCDVTQLCKFPYRARPSAEAVGVDVDGTVRRVGLRSEGALTGIVLAV